MGITIYEKTPTSSLFDASLCLPLASFALSRHLFALSLQASHAFLALSSSSRVAQVYFFADRRSFSNSLALLALKKIRDYGTGCLAAQDIPSFQKTSQVIVNFKP